MEAELVIVKKIDEKSLIVLALVQVIFPELTAHRSSIMLSFGMYKKE